MSASSGSSRFVEGMLPFILALVLYECAKEPIALGDREGAVNAVETSISKAIQITEGLGSNPKSADGPSEEDLQEIISFMRKVAEQLGEIELWD